MSNIVCDTGNGATISFSSSGVSYNYTGIDLGSESVTKIDKSHLLTVGNMRSMPGDLEDPGEVVVSFQFDNASAQPELRTIDTMTVTAPLAVRESDGQVQNTPATWAGTGFVMNVKKPNMQNNTLQDGQFTWAWDGATGPTFTPGTFA